MLESANHWWQNWPKTHGFVAEKMFFPTSVDDIALAIRESETDQRPLRAVGGGWSFSDASLPGMVTTNRPNVRAVEGINAVLPHAQRFPTDPMVASVANITAMPVADLPTSMVMFNESVLPPRIETGWVYLGGGRWVDPQGRLQGTAADPPGFLDWLAAGKLRPIKQTLQQLLRESDVAGSMVMFDLNENATVASRDWFYNGNGVWTVGISSDSAPRAPDAGTLQELAAAGRLIRPGGMNLSPRAADPADSLSVLLSKSAYNPAPPESVYLLNTRSLVSSLQQKLPSILSTSALDVTSETPTTGKQRSFFHVEAGITIAELGELLAHQSPRLSLQAISGSPGATLAGALATGTHGAEFNWPLVIDRVMAVHLVGPGGLQWWIEGVESIADPQKLRATYPGIAANRIIRGTSRVGGIVPHDWLGAAVVSLGCLGVVYSVVLEVVPQFGVREVVVQKTWEGLGSLGSRYTGMDLPTLLRTPATAKDVSSRIVKLMQHGNFSGTGIPQLDAQGNPVNQYADLAINPIRRVDGDFDCWIGNRQVTAQVPVDPKPVSGMIEGITRAFEPTDPKVKLGRVFGLGAVTDIPRVVADVIANHSRYKAMFCRLMRATDLLDIGLDVVLGPMSVHPDGPEAAQALLTGILSGLLNTANLARRSDITGVSVGALGFPASGLMGTAIEIAISPADAFGFVQTEILDKMTSQRPFYGYVSIRLCSKTETLLGMQQFGDPANPVSVMIEVVAFANDDARDFMQRLQTSTLTLIQGGLDAMLHWGLENEHLEAKHLAATKALQAQSRSGMTKLGTFKAVRTLLHTAIAPTTFRVFDNAFTERLGLSSRAGLAFCDEQRALIQQWVPTPLLAQAEAPLVANVGMYLHDLCLLNQSNRPVQVDEIRIVCAADLPNAPVFRVLSPRPFVVGVGHVVLVEVKYNGSAAGVISGVVEVECDRPIGATISIELAATVIANNHAELQVTPAALDLGTAIVGTMVGQNVILTNIGTGHVATFDSVAVVLDEPPGQFALPFVLPRPLQPGQSDTVFVSFSPTIRGPARATLAIDMRSRTDVGLVDFTRRHEVPLTGMARTPMLFLAAGPQQWRTIGGVRIPMRERPLTTLDFGTTPPSTAVSAPFWIRNVGDAPMTVQGVVEYNQNLFGISNAAIFPATLPPDGEMEVPCVFLAAAIRGLRSSGRFRVLTDDPRTTIDASVGDLSATGRAAGPHLTDPGELLRLGTLPPLTVSAPLVFRSDGTDPVRVKKIQLASASDFSLSGGTAGLLLPGSDLTVLVTLTATQPGAYQDQLVLGHDGNAGGGSQVLVQGTVG